MNEPNSQNEKPKENRRFSQEQYDMLKGCSDKKDMTEWNQWREKYPAEGILLKGGNFSGFYLKNANFMQGKLFNSGTQKTTDFRGQVHLEQANFEKANLDKAVCYYAHLEESRFRNAWARKAYFDGARLDNALFGGAHLEKSNFDNAVLENAELNASWLYGTEFVDAIMTGCSVVGCRVDGATCFLFVKVNQYSKSKRFTDFGNTPLANVILDPGTKQLLEYNVRRKNWEEWYPKQRSLLAWVVRRFWQMSDYGISTWRIIKTFFVVSMVFAIVYYLWGAIEYYYFGISDDPGLVANLFVDHNGPIEWCLVPIRCIYFSIVTMTTLGFGDIYANPHSYWWGWLGHLLLIFQVILGYVLLGALVTRFAVLFTAGGPAGKFADEEEEKDKTQQKDE